MSLFMKVVLYRFWWVVISRALLVLSIFTIANLLVFSVGVIYLINAFSSDYDAFT